MCEAGGVDRQRRDLGDRDASPFGGAPARTWWQKNVIHASRGLPPPQSLRRIVASGLVIGRVAGG